MHLAKETNLDIDLGTQINLNANLILHSDVKGKGILKIHSEHITHIDAHGHSVSNLLVKTKKKVILVSTLKIKEKIQITEGELVLQDEDLIVNEETKINQETIKHISRCQEGRLIQVRQYIHNVLFSSNLLYKTKIKAAKSKQLMLSQNNFLKSNRDSPPTVIHYLDPDIMVEAPPPKEENKFQFNNNKKSNL